MIRSSRNYLILLRRIGYMVVPYLAHDTPLASAASAAAATALALSASFLSASLMLLKYTPPRPAPPSALSLPAWLTFPSSSSNSFLSKDSLGTNHGGRGREKVIKT